MKPIIFNIEYTPFKWERNGIQKKKRVTIEEDCIKHHHILEREELKDKHDEHSGWEHVVYNWRVTIKRERLSCVEIAFLDEDKKWVVNMIFLGVSKSEDITMYFDEEKGTEAYDIFITLEKYMLNRPEEVKKKA